MKKMNIIGLSRYTNVIGITNKESDVTSQFTLVDSDGFVLADSFGTILTVRR